eukprot:TRINITY_DN37887_c0_g1_i1.p1 TRINITY_DN37887_c0_g1~~TRINITY_DN37887_c0_g1_i1.p1  ORF type:complete len:332 (-),score=62.37 TRINITY_DN37887_c0_g1_i1:171-1166(-)
MPLSAGEGYEGSSWAPPPPVAAGSGSPSCVTLGALQAPVSVEKPGDVDRRADRVHAPPPQKAKRKVVRRLSGTATKGMRRRSGSDAGLSDISECIVGPGNSELASQCSPSCSSSTVAGLGILDSIGGCDADADEDADLRLSARGGSPPPSCTGGSTTVLGLAQPRPKQDAVGQDPQASARWELAEAVRKRQADGLCRALPEALRLGIPFLEVQGALHALTELVRQSYVREAAADRFAEQSIQASKVMAQKLDRVSATVEKLQARFSTPGVGSHLLPAAAAAVSIDASSLSTTDLRDALRNAQERSEAAAAEAAAASAWLTLVQDEALRRLA